MAAMGVLAVLGLRDAGHAQRHLAELSRVTQLAGEAKFLTADFAGWQTGYAFDHRRGLPDATDDTKGQRGEFLKSTARFRTVLADLAKSPLTAGEQVLVTDAASAMDRFMAIDDKIIAGYRAGTPAAQLASDSLASGASLEEFGKIADDADALVSSVTQRNSALAAEARAEAERLQAIVAIIAVGASVIGVAAAIVVTRSITVPLARVRAVVRTLAAGDLTERFRTAGGKPRRPGRAGRTGRAGASDELSQIGADVDAAMDALHESLTALAATARELVDVGGRVGESGVRITGIAEATASRSNHAAATVGELGGNIESLSAGAEQVNASVQEISRSAVEATAVASDAVELAGEAARVMSQLQDSGEQIGGVLTFIATIAEQTNLLALNATIEAARAGDEGRGFAVVATEVKQLAGQSGKAAEDIRRRIDTIQSTTEEAAASIHRISEIVSLIHNHQSSIAAAVEQQTAATSEMSRNISQAADGAAGITDAVTGAAMEATQAAEVAGGNRLLADQLGRLADDLDATVKRFRL